MIWDMRIGELASAADASVRALRYYEQQGLLASRRRANGYREYDEHATVRVRNIRVLLDAGLTCADIRSFDACLDRELDAGQACSEAAALVEHRLHAVRERIEALVAVRVALEDELRRLRSGAHGQRGTAGVRRPPVPLPGPVRRRASPAPHAADPPAARAGA
jgi:DNA-binding transcriptional MerR regulator